ncbi:MAG TPA: DUF6491 family protein [Rhodanobacteraceae bacterium]|nr:DUF6491 family protein [Rhodanobacteraceae bacterium]
MKTAGKVAIGALVSAVSLAAFAQGPQQRLAERLALFQRYASPPQKSMHYFTTEGFEYLGKNAQGEDSLALWTGVNQVYLLTLQPPCIDLDRPLAIGVTSTSGDVNAGMDFVKYGHGRQCKIEAIQKVDYKAVRAAQASAGSGRGAA